MPGDVWPVRRHTYGNLPRSEKNWLGHVLRGLSPLRTDLEILKEEDVEDRVLRDTEHSRRRRKPGNTYLPLRSIMAVPPTNCNPNLPITVTLRWSGLLPNSNGFFLWPMYHLSTTTVKICWCRSCIILITNKQTKKLTN